MSFWGTGSSSSLPKITIVAMQTPLCPESQGLRFPWRETLPSYAMGGVVRAWSLAVNTSQRQMIAAQAASTSLA